MAKTASTPSHVKLDKKTSQTNKKSRVKTSSMNKSRKRSFKADRGQGKF